MAKPAKALGYLLVSIFVTLPKLIWAKEFNEDKNPVL